MFMWLNNWLPEEGTRWTVRERGGVAERDDRAVRGPCRSGELRVERGGIGRANEGGWQAKAPAPQSGEPPPTDTRIPRSALSGRGR
jgi:hypothetical protein